MNALSTLGSYFRPLLDSSQATTQSGQRRGSAQSPAVQDSSNSSLSGAASGFGLRSLSDASSMLQRAADFGSTTIAAAKAFVTSFAESLFGDAAKGMSISFDSSSVSASSSFASLVQHTEDSNGSSDSAALRLEDVADFIGQGTITTADGHSFSFEVEVHYESTLEMAASSTTTNQRPAIDGETGESRAAPPRHAEHDDHRQRPAATREGLAAHFPGSVTDLFNMLDHDSLNLSFRQASGDADAASGAGSMKLHLLELLANLDSISQKLAKSYGDLPSFGKHAEAA